MPGWTVRVGGSNRSSAAVTAAAIVGRAGADERAARAADVLRELGGCCEPAATNGTITVGCTACPLAVAAEGHPEVCRMVETMLTAVLGVSVRQRCQTDPLQCRFEFDRTHNV